MPATAWPLHRPRPADRKVRWRNLHQPTRVRLHLQGRALEGAATASSDPKAVADGLRRHLARYPRPPSRSVWLDANGTPHLTATGAHPLVVVMVCLDRR